MADQYRYYRGIFKGRRMPLAYVDLDLFDQNVQDILRRAGCTPLCVASKSIRCVALIRRIQEASSRFHSIMAYSAREAVFLAENGMDDIRVAYPVWREVEGSGVSELLKAGKRISLMVDCLEHVQHLESIGARTGTVFQLCMDADMSSSYPGLYFGVRRSGISTPERAVSLWRAIKERPHVRLAGLMGYEAQIAGLQDRPPGRRLSGYLLRRLKRRSIQEVRRRRSTIVEALRRDGCALEFVNGGGTGSVETTVERDVVTEVTVGSGFFSPALFDHYDRFHHQPAAGFAIEIVRRPALGIYTCQGGGYVASGAAGQDKLPQPYLPVGAALIPREGAGEVQTPILYRGNEELSLGDPICMRHSKAGELCERFNSLVLVSAGAIADEVPTYRGQGMCFL